MLFLATIAFAATTAYTLPFSIDAVEDVSSQFPGAPRIHSFVSAEWQGHWIFLAGRFAGYHGEGGKDADFPRAGANDRIWVITLPAAGRQARTYSLPLSKLPAALGPVKDQWMSSNPQFAQVGETLYITGGYGQNSHGSWVTYPLLSAVHLPSLVKAVTTHGDLAQARIRYIESPHVQVTGGEMLNLGDGHLYLAGGHKFMGSYRDFEASGEKNTKAASQEYTSAIRKLRIDPATLATTLVETFQDPEFRRRDWNVTPMILADGHSLGGAAYGGVFTADQLAFTKPLYWNARQPPQVAKDFDQKMSAYACAHLSLYDSATKQMFTTFFGGISGWLWSSARNAFEPAARAGEKSSAKYMDGLQWIDWISTIALDAKGRHTETVQPSGRMPAYLGANAVFLPVADLPRVRADADVFDLQAIKGKQERQRVLAGYLFGGIRAFPKQFPYRDDSPDYNSGNVPSRASELILAVYLSVPAQQPAPQQTPATSVEPSNSNPRR